MILLIECSVDSETIIDDIIEWRVNSFVIKFYPAEQKVFRKISVECKFLDYLNYAPKVTVENKQLTNIEFPEEDFYSEQISILQHLESFSALDLGVRRIHWDSPSIKWIAENEEEEIAIRGYTKKQSYPVNDRKITLKWIQQTLANRRMVNHLVEPLSFYRIGLNHYHSHYYIQAFLHFYLMLEGVFGKGKSRKDETIIAFLNEPKLVSAIQTALENFERPDFRKHKAWFENYSFDNLKINGDPVRKMINIFIDQRGLLAHNVGLNSERRRNNFEEKKYQALAATAMGVCLLVSRELRLDPYRRKDNSSIKELVINLIPLYQAVFAAFNKFLLLFAKGGTAAKILHPKFVIFGNTNFFKTRVHQVTTVAFAFKPACHHFGDAGLPKGNVFAYHKAFPAFKYISCGNNTVVHSTAIFAFVAKIILPGHIFGMPYCSIFQIVVPNHRRGRREIGITTLATFGTCFIDDV